MQLSGRETYEWSTRPGAAWPCSDLADSALCIEVNSNGLCDMPIGRECSSNELESIVSDFLPDDCKHLWPTWKAPNGDNVFPPLTEAEREQARKAYSDSQQRRNPCY